MSRPQGEDDGSVLEYVTEDEPQRARQIARYTILDFFAGKLSLSTRDWIQYSGLALKFGGS